MKLATLMGGRDGTLVVVSRDLTRCRAVPEIAATLQAALDDWEVCEPRLRAVSYSLGSTDATFMPAGVETMTQASASKRWTIAGGFGGSSASHAALAAHTVAEAARTNEGIAMM